MNVIERMEANRTELKIDHFRLKQKLPYECKRAYAEIKPSKVRIKYHAP